MTLERVHPKHDLKILQALSVSCLSSKQINSNMSTGFQDNSYYVNIFGFSQYTSLKLSIYSKTYKE